MITLRPNQIDAVDAVEAAHAAGMRRPLVDSCVASGKSLVFAELARREIARGGTVLICAHTRELVEQNAKACRDLMPGLHVGINAAALDERCWRAPVISAAIQSVHKYAPSFGPISLFGVDEAHLIPHSESGMYRALDRALGYPKMAGGSGTTYRLQGGSLVEGEGAPFDAVVYRYSILDGIRDGYLVPAFSVQADDKLDVSKLKVRQGEFTGDSQDAQMIAAMDNHIAQAIHYGRERRAWLCFEASTKAARAMCARMNEWQIPTGLVLGTTPAAERKGLIEAFRAGRLRALVNVAALTTGFDVPTVDFLIMRRRTKSLGLYVQMTGRLLRTIGGTIASSIAAGKADGLVIDFAGNIDQHGPLDFLQPKESKSRLVSCDHCGTRNGAAARTCWRCDSPLLKNCPACLEAIAKHQVVCPLCAYDMRAGPREDKPGAGLLETPSGASLIAGYRPGKARVGGWLTIRKVWAPETGQPIVLVEDDGCESRVGLPEALAPFAATARWLRMGADGVSAMLLPNGDSRSSARQIMANGSELIIPMPYVV
ncbi:MAG: hypothetical protein HXX10_07405 [Rhodoplanes sp.]|uniref:helicase-related protein n=1 Tax=Rhodoplanes sp. TaxID=1968906 RepID=UPI0017BE3ADC|nr:helicase-related protein [Rhodoplanes sp.]NVO13846.1 hypothetical protein [Rhodoplanes sp.]